MKSLKTKLFAIILIGSSLSIVNAQQATSSSGGDATGSGGSVAYTIGQTTYTTNVGTIGSMAQGVQQAYEISIISELDDPELNLNLSIYPNPAANLLTLKVDIQSNENLSYQLFDMHGKLLEIKKITNSQESISMINLAPATYLLKVTYKNQEIQTYKIIKN